MLFSIPQLIAVVSKVHTLEEGDLLLTGTPAGVGPVVPGDNIEIGIEELASSASFKIQ
jgi:acylpyruvate hydrolase